ASPIHAGVVKRHVRRERPEVSGPHAAMRELRSPPTVSACVELAEPHDAVGHGICSAKAFAGVQMPHGWRDDLKTTAGTVSPGAHAFTCLIHSRSCHRS